MAIQAKPAGVTRFVFASSCSNHGRAREDFVDENGQLNPQTDYGVSNVLIERGLRLLADDSFILTFLRFAISYGVSPRMRFEIVLNNLIGHAAYTSCIIVMMSDGTPWRPIIHIEDMSRAFLATLLVDRDVISREAFDVCRTENNYQIRGLAEIVANILPDAKIDYVADAEPDNRTYSFSSEKIGKCIPEFKPK